MKTRKILTFILSFAIAMSSIIPVHAETTETIESVVDSAIQETNQSEQMEAEENVLTDIEAMEEILKSGTVLEQEETAGGAEEELSYEIKNISIASKVVEAGNKQIITVLMNNTQEIENAALIGFAEDKGTEIQYGSTSVTETEIIFEIYHDQADVYTLEKLEIQTEQGLLEFDLSVFDSLSYAVSGLEKGELNNGISFFSVNQFTGVNGDDGTFVIVLDPGHDPGCNTRGVVNGVWETELNWKIAEAMKAELEIYPGVEVYINRVWEECPEAVDSTEENKVDCLKARVVRAANLKADLLISIHNNAYGYGELQNLVRGAEIYVTRYPAYNMEANGLAEKILTELEEMGLKNNGVKTRYYGNDATDTYDDGTGWDYYAINRHSTLMGIPSLLIEHAYMDNAHDLTILRDDAKLKEIGERNAQAIIEYYDLQLVTEAAGDLVITQTIDDWIDIKISNAVAPYSISGVKVRMWSEAEGDENAKWYDATLEGKVWKTSFDLNQENMGVGRYIAELYFVDANGVEEYVKESAFDVTESKNVVADVFVVDKDTETGDFTVKVSNLTVPYEVNKVHLEIWAEENGRDNAISYQAELIEKEWIVNVKGTEHNEVSGTYHIYLYVTDQGGMVHEVKSVSTEIAVEKKVETQVMYRLYNPNSGEHFYTASAGEKNHLVVVGWNYEGIGWYAPVTGHPVYRLYNPNAGDHHYTLSAGERDYLVEVGWRYEGIGWYSDVEETVPLYRLYNPNAVAGAHHYTTNYNEAKYLDEVGWNYEGIGWYGALPQ